MAKLDWQRFGINDVSKYDYIVGIDFGHRQTSAHCVGLSENRYEPAKVYLDHNEHSVIPTQFAVDGNDIILGDIRGYEHQYIYFKRNPEELNNGYLYSDEDITCKELVQKFIGKIITNIEAHNADLLNKNILYIVGCPSGDEWFRNNNDVEYAKILRGGNDRDIVVIDEVRGIQKLASYEYGISVDENEGILIFDYSDTDLKSIFVDKYNFQERCIIDKISVGFLKICETVMNIILREHNKTKADLAYRVNAQYDTIYEVEAAYDSYGSGNQIKHRVFYELKNGDEISQNINEELLDYATKKERIFYAIGSDVEIVGTYESICRMFIQFIKDRVEREKPGFKIKNIVLISSKNVYFIKDILKDVFRCTDDIIISNIESPGCVSKGLAYIGQEMYYKTKE